MRLWLRGIVIQHIPPGSRSVADKAKHDVCDGGPATTETTGAREGQTPRALVAQEDVQEGYS